MSNKSLPPLNWLRTFEVSARHLSFTSAAEELCLTQGAVSRQIRLLEDHLDVPLFRRMPRSLSLTEEGLAYISVVQDAVSRLAAGTSEIFDQHHREPVKIRGSLAFFTLWLAPKLSQFKKQHPDIDIRYTSNIWLTELDANDDMEIRWGHGQWPGLISQRLTWDSLFPVCSPKLLARNPIVQPADLLHHPLLHVIGYEEGWSYWFKMMDVEAVGDLAGMQFDTLVSTLRVAELNQGIALARSSLVNDLLASGSLVELFDQRIEASESFYLVYRSGENLNEAATKFCNWLVERAHIERSNQ